MKHGSLMLAAGAVCAFAATMLATGCERDFFHTPGARDIVFSADTLSFDTIYAGFTTPTRRLLVRNVGDEDVTLDRIVLEGGASSPFMVNIGGLPSADAQGVRLCGGDSLFVFFSVQEPRVAGGLALGRLSDRLIVSGGANSWAAVVQAVVRNVEVAPSAVSADVQWLCDSIPYLVEDSLAVESGATLLIGPGVTVLMDRGAVVSVEGRLVVAAEPARRSSFAPLRSDGFYESIPGQWGGVRLGGGALADVSYCDFACPSFGFLCDSSSSLSADGVWIRDVAKAGVAASMADVRMSNSIVSDCGGGAFSLRGGRAILRHVTVADYYSWDHRSVPALSFGAAGSDEASLTVDNSIIVGGLSAEVEADSMEVGRAQIRHSLVKADKKKVSAASDVFVGCVVATDARFADRLSADYHLTESSAAIGLADRSLAADLPSDFEGAFRRADEPWHAGALQSVE